MGGLGREVGCRGRSWCLFGRKRASGFGGSLWPECMRPTQGWGPSKWARRGYQSRGKIQHLDGLVERAAAPARPGQLGEHQAEVGGWLCWRPMTHSVSSSCDTWTCLALARVLVLDGFVALDLGWSHYQD